MGIKIIALILAISSYSAFANSQCLENASNSELVRELEKRLGNGQGGGYGLLDVTCTGSMINFTMLTENAVEMSHSVDVKFNSDCATYLAQIGSSLKVTALQTIAVCQRSILHRVALSAQTLRALKTQDLRFASECESKAAEINR